MNVRFADIDGFLHTGSGVPKMAGECPRCQKHAVLYVRHHNPIEPMIKIDGENLYVVILECSWCNLGSCFLRRGYTTEKPGGSDYTPNLELIETLEATQLWPERAPRSIAAEAPQKVREFFSEAALAEAAGANRLAGVGYRAVVEQIVKERGAPGKNLFERIRGLAALGVSQEIVDSFNEARFVGNDAAHDGLAYSNEEIAGIAELIEEAVLVLYVQPAQRAKLAQQRADRRAAAKA